MKLAQKNWYGETVGEAILNLRVAKEENASHIVHRALVRQMNNARQGTASTKTRAEVRGGGRKPWRQKGTGRARAGSIRSPLWRGGGVIFGPKPRDYSTKLNKKERKLALTTALSSRAEDIIIVEDFEVQLPYPKTKEIIHALERWGIDINSQKLAEKILLIVPPKQEKVRLSTRNIDKLKTICPDNLNTYDILYADKIIITRKAFDTISDIHSESVQDSRDQSNYDTEHQLRNREIEGKVDVDLPKTSPSKVDPYLLTAFEMLQLDVVPQFIGHKKLANGKYLLPMVVNLDSPLLDIDKISDFQILFDDQTSIACYGSEATVEELNKHSAVKSIDASLILDRGGSYNDNLSIANSNQNLEQTSDYGEFSLINVHEREQGNQAIVAIIDTGIDILHEAFLDNNGNSRVIGILDTTQGQSAREYSELEINQFVRSGNIPNDLGRDPQGHGTSIASVAVGSPIQEVFAGGVSPESKIVLVKIKDRDPKGLLISIKRGLQYIESVVNHCPVVINISQGVKFGARDGFSPIEQQCQQFLDQGYKKNCAVVVAAGNEGDNQQHHQGRLPSSNISANPIEWIVLPDNDEQQSCNIEFWTDSRFTDLEFCLEVNGFPSKWVRINEAEEFKITPNRSEGYSLRFIESNRRSDTNQLIIITVIICPSSRNRKWKLFCRNRSRNQGATDIIHGWVSFGRHEIVWFNNDQSLVTLTIPATAENVITVGSISSNNAGNINVPISSSRGRTRDSRYKPDLVAPGENILAACSGTYNDFREITGTSAAAAYVTGAIALMLSCANKRGINTLTAALIRKKVLESTSNYGISHNEECGYGVLDINQLLLTVTQ